MNRTILFNTGIISGLDKETIIEIIPELVNCFTQRKQYSEYYFEQKNVELTLEQLDKLSNEYKIILCYETLIINVY